MAYRVDRFRKLLAEIVVLMVVLADRQALSDRTAVSAWRHSSNGSPRISARHSRSRCEWLCSSASGSCRHASLEEGETISTECSYKFTPGGICELAKSMGFLQCHRWIAQAARFALTLFEAV